jgi:hypothetical protein
MERAYLQAKREAREAEQETERDYLRLIRERWEQEGNDAREEAERTIREELERKYQADMVREWAASEELERTHRKA